MLQYRRNTEPGDHSEGLGRKDDESLSMQELSKIAEPDQWVSTVQESKSIDFEENLSIAAGVRQMLREDDLPEESRKFYDENYLPGEPSEPH